MPSICNLSLGVHALKPPASWNGGAGNGPSKPFPRSLRDRSSSIVKDNATTTSTTTTSSTAKNNTMTAGSSMAPLGSSSHFQMFAAAGGSANIRTRQSASFLAAAPLPAPPLLPPSSAQPLPRRRLPIPPSQPSQPSHSSLALRMSVSTPMREWLEENEDCLCGGSAEVSSTATANSTSFTLEGRRAMTASTACGSNTNTNGGGVGRAVRVPTETQQLPRVSVAQLRHAPSSREENPNETSASLLNVEDPVRTLLAGSGSKAAARTNTKPRVPVFRPAPSSSNTPLKALSSSSSSKEPLTLQDCELGAWGAWGHSASRHQSDEDRWLWREQVHGGGAFYADYPVLAMIPGRAFRKVVRTQPGDTAQVVQSLPAHPFMYLPAEGALNSSSGSYGSGNGNNNNYSNGGLKPQPPSLTRRKSTKTGGRPVLRRKRAHKNQVPGTQVDCGGGSVMSALKAPESLVMLPSPMTLTCTLGSNWMDLGGGGE